jgi:hypothetical protein
VEAAFVVVIYSKSEKENLEIKFELPRLEIASIMDE